MENLNRAENDDRNADLSKAENSGEETASQELIAETADENEFSVYTEAYAASGVFSAAQQEEASTLKSILDEAKLQLSEFFDEEDAAENQPEEIPPAVDALPPVKKRGFIKGGSRFVFLTSLINFCLYAVWVFAYFICLILRDVFFTGAQTEMSLAGYQSYTLQVSSPVFPLLKFAAFLLPVIVIIWTAGIVAADKKKKEAPDRRLLIAAFAADFAVGILSAFDIVFAGMIF